ncbi:hypothetical protein PPTG_16357 [Phytophthora nicotianae INRA-310]|uniref:WLGC domain-containing protein n=1 Tax=Phytophthora nicotianae (strain INRA-310) TaxID=761204 RepID=W2PR16_PHYN3|nr:hypothetical protein PPTG_16357 [Phytophthora nicotianae INRA-310]ETN03327.1 hypothetical protein PPTG_16357 [Phytophthora nicotianae INRA-310]
MKSLQADDLPTAVPCADDTCRRNSHIRRSRDGSVEWLKTLRAPDIVPLEHLSDPMSASFDAPRQVLNRSGTQRLSFWQVFGLLGIPMLLFLVMSIVWTAWLIILTLAPNETANYLMHTGDYDDGHFWLLAEQEIGIKFARIGGLMLAVVGYLHIMVKMLVWRTVPASFEVKTGGVRKASIENKKVVMPTRRRSITLEGLWYELTSINGPYRKFWNLAHKTADLITQIILLSNYLEQGFPDILVYGWVAFISCNCLSCALNILLNKHSALTEILVDSIFDLIATIVYPILILIYCYHNFQFDHEVFRTYVEVLPPGSFEIIARLHIEGKQGSENLVYLPSDLFSNMPQLLFLHLALHPSLRTLPALDGTPKLQTLELAHLFGLSRLPDLDKTVDLHGIVIAYLPLLETLPDLLKLKHLVSVTVFRPSFLCCNGYLGSCDLNHPFCDADNAYGFPAAMCLTDNKLQASSAMVKYLENFGPAVCYKTPDSLLEFADIPTKASVDMCGGVPYRRCDIVDPVTNEMFEGLCYNLRMQVLSCNPDPHNIEVRKLQIRLNVGTPCDPVEEAWLGCTDKR